MSDSSPTLLIVGGGPFQLDIIHAARAAGCRVAVADRDPDAIGLTVADIPLAIDIVDPPRLLARAREIGIDGVVTAASDIALPAVAHIGAALGLPAIAPQVAARCRDKLSMFEAVRAAGLPVPETIWVQDAAQARAEVPKLGGFPVVVKPRSAAGGRGVSVVRDAGSLEPAVDRARRYDPRGCLLQTFVGGHAVGVEAYFAHGAALTQLVMDDQFMQGFVSPVGHALPSDLSESDQDTVRDAVAAFASTLGLTDGPANFDLRLESGRCVLIEVNARLGGNSITDLARHAYGVDLSAAVVHAAVGRDPSRFLVRHVAAPTASRLILHYGGGVLGWAPDGAARVDKIRQRGDVLALELAANPGDELRLRVDDYAVVGRCVVHAPSASQAASEARAISQAVLAAVTVSG